MDALGDGWEVEANFEDAIRLKTLAGIPAAPISMLTICYFSDFPSASSHRRNLARC